MTKKNIPHMKVRDIEIFNLSADHCMVSKGKKSFNVNMNEIVTESNVINFSNKVPHFVTKINFNFHTKLRLLDLDESNVNHNSEAQNDMKQLLTLINQLKVPTIESKLIFETNVFNSNHMLKASKRITKKGYASFEISVSVYHSSSVDPMYLDSDISTAMYIKHLLRVRRQMRYLFDALKFKCKNIMESHVEDCTIDIMRHIHADQFDMYLTKEVQVKLASKYPKAKLKGFWVKISECNVKDCFGGERDNKAYMSEMIKSQL